jgi:hypothetical protein
VKLAIDRPYSGWDGYDIWNRDEWVQLDDEEFHNDLVQTVSVFHAVMEGSRVVGCNKGVHVPAQSLARNSIAVLSNKNAGTCR